MIGMLDKLISCCVPKADQQLVNDLISNEEFHYVARQDMMWDIKISL